MPLNNNLPDDMSKSEQSVLNQSFDDTYKLLSVQMIGNDGTNARRIKTDVNGGIQNSDSPMAQKVSVSGAITYVAIAPCGTAQSSAQWQVKKIDQSGGTATIITWADGNSNFDNVATDLTSLTYS